MNTKPAEPKYVKWISDDVLSENQQASVAMYKFIETDFLTCLEYVPLDEKHMNVYSYRFASSLLRVGPELLRKFNITFFDSNRSCSLHFGCLESILLELQEKCNNKNDYFMDYYHVLSVVLNCSISRIAIKVKPINKYILPFEIEMRDGKKTIPWWEDGYNALRHRVTYEFKDSATFRNTLFALSALWFLHYQFDPRMSYASEIFETYQDKDSNDVVYNGILKYKP